MKRAARSLTPLPFLLTFREIAEPHPSIPWLLAEETTADPASFDATEPADRIEASIE